MNPEDNGFKYYDIGRGYTDVIASAVAAKSTPSGYREISFDDFTNRANTAVNDPRGVQMKSWYDDLRKSHPEWFTAGAKSGVTTLNGTPTAISAINPNTGQVDINKELAAQGASGAGAIPGMNTQTGQILDPNAVANSQKLTTAVSPENLTGAAKELYNKTITSSGGKAPTDLVNDISTGATGAKVGTGVGSDTVATSDAERTAQRKAEIERIKSELSGGANAPTLYKSADEFKRLRQEQGVVQDESELSSIQNEARLAKEELNQFKQTSNKEISQGGYLGGISEAERNLNFRMSSLALREQAVVDRLNNKNSYINTIVNLGKEDYQTALTNYNNEYNKNVKAIDLYNSELDDQQKDALTGFTTMSNLLAKSGLTTLTPQLSQQLDSLALKAGLPSGVFQQALKGLSANEKIDNMKIIDNNVYMWTTDSTGTPKLKLVQTVGTGNAPVGLTPEQQKDPFIQTIIKSAGGKPLTDTSIQKLDKGLTVLGQIGVLQSNIEDMKTGPIVGAFRGINPWDTKAQTIKASLNAVVPNLARGVYGEVGVLTDNDIKNYSKTLPTLSSTEAIRNGILYITLDMIGKSIKNTLTVNAAAGRDVSRFVDIYTEMESAKASVLSTIPTSQIPSAFKPSGNSEYDAFLQAINPR